MTNCDSIFNLLLIFETIHPFSINFSSDRKELKPHHIHPFILTLIQHILVYIAPQCFFYIYIRTYTNGCIGRQRVVQRVLPKDISTCG